MTGVAPNVQSIVNTFPFGLVTIVNELTFPEVKLLIVKLVTLALRVNKTTVVVLRSTVATPDEGVTEV